MKLTDHFTVAEVEKSERALRLGIDNTAPPEVIDAALIVGEGVLEPVRMYFGQRPFSPNSWYRSPEVDAAIRSPETHAAFLAGEWKPKSQHITGSAVDIEIPGVSNLELAYWIADNLEFDQLILEFYIDKPSSGWVHVSKVASLNRMQKFTTANGKIYTRGLPA